ncbi:hypothetical protein BC938DRAFT_481529 [Jimgerdemannia flammicorona]|uniref:Eukaryotic translation initiation factor 3 subunit A n=1 Tax=Jimgerdemannia flammicorona TaxID=994334 RepID=A0A433QG38_9FUNG|nr:hypothetical protein BC938DRAFT_481529 [Jimgerdemannia flammicorona]
MEPIMLKFVELCVNLRKGKTAKEGLHQYKNIAQNTSVGTIELVIRKFIELAEEKVTEAQAKADKITLDAIDDLEASETPESIMLSTVSGEQSKDRTDRAVVTPWLKFLWESYRTVLDILRNNARLEILYQAIANQAFHFCFQYARKTEFRRLCDLLRNHLQNIAKYAHQPHSINLNEPESLQRHLDTRFNQLSAAVDLELWQEAFRSVEDVHNLLSMSKRPPKPSMMANYYEKLTKIFMVSENYLFHAASWNRYFTLVRAQGKPLTEDEQTRMTSLVLLSALSIPVIASTKGRPGYVEADEQKNNKAARLSSLLGMGAAPSRSGLLKEALSKNILRRVRPELRELYNILEVQFHPLSICKKINPIMTQLAQDTEFAKYVKPLHQVILTRLLQQLSQVYTTIKLEFVINLASFPEPYNYDAATIEKFIMNGCKRGELSIRIDHATRSLTFETDLFAAPKRTVAEGPKLQSSPSDLMRTQLSRLAKCLHTTVHMIYPSELKVKETAKKEAFGRALAGAEEEHQGALARKVIIERKKELIETLIMRKEKIEAAEKARRAQQEAETERLRLAEEAKKREIDRIRKANEDIQRQEAEKLVEHLKKNKIALQMNPAELANADTQTLVKLQVEQIEKEKKELNDRLKAIAKRMDHIERAFRQEEIPLLEKDYERQRKADRAYHEAARKAQLEAAVVKHAEDLKIKSRMVRIMPDYLQYRKEIEAKRHEEFEARRKAAQAKIDEEKQRRLDAYRSKKERERQEREAAETASRQREEDERRIQEEQELRATEQRAKIEKEKSEYEEKKRHLDELAARQREKERLVEEKLAARQREKEQETSRAPTVTTGKYVPPALASGGWRSRRTDERRSEDQTTPVASTSASASATGTWRRAATREPEREPLRQSESEKWRPREDRRDTGDSAWRRKEDGEDRPAWRSSREEQPKEDRTSPIAQEDRRIPAKIGGTEGGWRARAAAKEQAERGTGNAGESGTANVQADADDEGFETVKRPIKRK